MQKKILFNEGQLEYTVRKSKRAKRVSVSVYKDCSVVLVMPHRSNETTAEGFLREKLGWIIEKIEEYKKTLHLSPATGTRREFIAKKADALRLAREKTNHYCNLYGVKRNRISVKNQKTKWGSCSSAGNLNYNYRIVFLPEELVNYLIVHEVCHLIEMNHSRKFWNLVSQQIPNYKELRKKLAKMHL